MIIPVILSGGSGTRLWPLSREAYPKQFLPLIGELSLFQHTVQRLAGMDECTEPLVICNEEHRFLAQEQLGQIDITPAGIMLEPAGRNTAPAIGCAALHAGAAEEILLVMPSDHIIEDIEEFQRCISNGLSTARNGALITYGIVADRPETGYGYIRRLSESMDDINVYAVEAFIEKPDLETARALIESSDNFWNSGIFMFRADSYLQALEEFRPDILASINQAYSGLVRDNDFLRLDEKTFLLCPSESIDYAVMEKTDKAVVIPMQAGWSDLGAWPALGELSAKDEQGNITSGDTITRNSSNNYIHSTRRLVSAIGITDTIIVETADAVLVADRSHAGDVKEIVSQLKLQERQETVHHVCVYRPWGSFETIDEGPGFKVKRIIVKPGASLSLQMHHQRAEHWVVVKGEARVTRGDEIFDLGKDQSTYIPVETRHRLENLGTEPLEIIEVQTGEYLGEDDIVRFSDNYGR